jgi:N6-adenosine-specific RNA methylase IME4
MNNEETASDETVIASGRCRVGSDEDREWLETLTGPPYRTIVADPPWPSMHQRATYHRGKPERHYETMTIEEIAELPVSDLAEEDAHLWLWGVNRLLGDAYRIAEAWGFTPMSLLTWKKPGPGMGYYLRNNTEHAVFATRGRPMVPSAALPSSLYEWPRGRHSEKPDAFIDVVESVSPAPRLEMFARRARFGWDYCGDESLGTASMPEVSVANGTAAPTNSA